MKKILFILVVLCASLTTVNAQVKFGVRAGYNLTNVSGGLNADNKSGFYAGPTVKFTVPIVGLSFDASAVYDQRTAKAGGEDITSKNINIPINVRYGVGLSSLTNIFVFAGPQFGFNVGKDLKNIQNTATDWKWKESNFSVNVGIGATVLSKVEIKANYNIACGKTGEVKGLDVVEGAFKGNYNAWQVGLAYWF